jgi:hypothetical protein
MTSDFHYTNFNQVTIEDMGIHSISTTFCFPAQILDAVGITNGLVDSDAQDATGISVP